MGRIEAARTSGADAIHPGYGFLSENADFAEAVVAAGLIWVGPKGDTIRSLGLKDEAKKIAEGAGVPVLPGYRGSAQDAATLSKEADKIGYPILIKAVAGGGGRGIRLVTSADMLPAELDSAVREAKSAFGDGRVMLEKLVEQPRHIEVQVFGDSHGNAVHLFERDCSLQRRRQKVVEEAPAPGMPDDVRAAMTGAAVKLAKSVGYEGAGTVEFIVDGARPLALDTFWFLEMNTRLQVEHPVTELVTDTDLVEWQLRVASGEKIPRDQADIELSGHAIEARICAEDPANDFRPGAGRILAFDLSNGGDESDYGVFHRVDTGFEAGDSVPATYDSMIAKLIVKADTREEAIAALADNLAVSVVAGIPSNTGFLHRCVTADAFMAGEHHVNWIAEHIDTLATVPGSHRKQALDLVATMLMEGDSSDPWRGGDGWRLNAAPRRSIHLAIGEDVVAVHDPEAGAAALSSTASIQLSDSRFAVTVESDSFLVMRADYEAEAEALAGGDAVKAPMPGKLIALNVAAGDTVAKGSVVAVMEAMKMEHSLTAPRDGVIESVSAEVGEQVADGFVIAALIPA